MTALRKASELHNKIADLNHSDLNQIAIHRLIVEAKSYLTSDPLTAYVALGMLAGLNNDVAGVRKNFDAALNLDHSAFTYANYGIALARIDQYPEALHCLKIAFDKDQGDLELIRTYINISYISGNFILACDLIEHCFKLGQSKDIPYKNEAPEIRDFLVSVNIKEEELKIILSIAYDMIHEFNVFSPGTEVVLATDGTEATLDFTILVEGGVQKTVEMTTKLAKHRAKNVKNSYPEYISVGYVPA